MSVIKWFLKLFGIELGLKLYVNGRRVVGPQSLLDSLGTGIGKVEVTQNSVTNSIIIGSIGSIRLSGTSLNGVFFRDMEYETMTLTEEYAKLLCSACPFCEGEAEYVDLMGAVIPCSLWNGVLYRLPAPDRCAMVGSKQYTLQGLYDAILAEGGPEALATFQRRQQELSGKC
jgi:hypothetical protein